MDTLHNGSEQQQLVCVMQYMPTPSPIFDKSIVYYRPRRDSQYDWRTNMSGCCQMFLRGQSSGTSSKMTDSLSLNIAGKSRTSSPHGLSETHLRLNGCLRLLLLWISHSSAAFRFSTTFLIKPQNLWGFFSGHFRGANAGLYPSDSEILPNFGTIERMHWLIHTSGGFELYLNYIYIVWLFSATKLEVHLSQTAFFLKSSVLEFVC